MPTWRSRLLLSAGLVGLLALLVWYLLGDRPPSNEERFARATAMLEEILEEGRTRVEAAADRLARLARAEREDRLRCFRDAERIVADEGVDGVAVVDWDNRARFWAGRTTQVDPTTAFYHPKMGSSTVGTLEEPAQRLIYAAYPAGDGVALAFKTLDQRFPRRDDLGERVAQACGLSRVELNFGRDVIEIPESTEVPWAAADIEDRVHATFFAKSEAQAALEADAARRFRLHSLLFGLVAYAALAIWTLLVRRLPVGGVPRAFLIATLLIALRVCLSLLGLPATSWFEGGEGWLALWAAPGDAFLTAFTLLCCAIALARIRTGNLALAWLGAAGSAGLARFYYLLVAALADRADGIEIFDPLRVTPEPAAWTLLISLCLLTGAVFVFARAAQVWAASVHRLASAVPFAIIALGMLPWQGPWLAAGCLLAVIVLRGSASRPERAATVAFLAAIVAFPPLYLEHREVYLRDVALRAGDLIQHQGRSGVKERLERAVEAARHEREGVDVAVATRLALGIDTHDVALQLWAAARWDPRDPCTVQVWDAEGRLVSSFDFDGPPSWTLPKRPTELIDNAGIRNGTGTGEAIHFLTHDFVLRTIGDERVAGIARFSVPDRWDMLLTSSRPTMFAEPADLLLPGRAPPVFIAELAPDGTPTLAGRGSTAEFEVPDASLLDQAREHGYVTADTTWRGAKAQLVLSAAKYHCAAVVFAEDLLQQGGFAFSKVLLSFAAACLAYIVGLLIWRRGRLGLRFRHRIVLFVALLTVPPVALLGFYNQRMAKGGYDEDIRERLEARLDLAENLLRDRRELVDTEWCTQFASTHHMDINAYRGAELVATSRIGVWDAGLLSRLLAAPPYVMLELADRTDYVGVESFAPGASMHAAYRKVKGGWGDEPIIVAAPALEDQRDLDRREAQGTALLIASYLVAAIVTTFLGMLLARTLTKPVRELESATARVAIGDMRTELPENRTDEFGELMRAFNRMTRDLADTQDLRVRAEKAAAWREMSRQIAHDIKNPLTPIKLTIQNLLAAYEEDPNGFEEQFKAGGELILGQIEALHRIAGQFSTYARLPVRNPQPIDLGELVDEVASLYAAAGEVLVERRGEKDPDKLVVMGDRDELLRALGNLVTNARQAKATRVSISMDLQDSYLRMVVNDNGAGIEPDILERIFEPSFTTKTSGTGLGMPIVKRIVDDHAGTIALRSTPGLGTRVTILLPYTAPEPGADSV